MKKIVIVLTCTLLMLAMGTAVFAGGAKEITTTPEGKEKVVWAAYGYLAENKAGRIKDDFEAKYPQYEIEYVDLGSTDYLVRLDTMVAAGERLDMALAMDSVEYTARAREEMFLPIEEYVTKDGFDLLDGFGEGIKASYINGVLYGLPYTKGGFYIFYNKDMFDAAGMPYPTDDWTWAEFEEIAKKLTTDKVHGANIHLTWGYDIDTLPAQMAGWSPFKNNDPNTANFDDPRLKEALAMWHRMQNIDKSAISLGTFKAEQIGSRFPFALGQASMLLSNWWSASWFVNSKFGSADGDKILNFNIGVVNLPRPNKSVPNNLNATDLDYYFAVPSTAKNPEGGALLARFMICEMWSKLGTLSSYRHQDLEEFKSKFVTFVDKDEVVYTMDYSDEFVEKVMGGWTQPISSYYNFDNMINPQGLAAMKTVFNQERELLYLNQQSLDATVADMQKRAQAELNSLKK